MSAEQSTEQAQVHWGSKSASPTSLHGNGAASFDHTTLWADRVTCGLCMTLLVKAREERQAELDLAPIPAEEVWSTADVVGGVALVHLGEDGEEAITPGHRITDEEFAAALAEWGSGEPEDYAAFEAVWLIARRHAPDCREDLEFDEDCGCGEEWLWWASYGTKDDPGAIAVTRWSA